MTTNSKQFGLLSFIVLLSLLVLGCASTSGTWLRSPENPGENIHSWIRHIKVTQLDYMSSGEWTPIVVTAAGTHSAERMRVGFITGMADWGGVSGETRASLNSNRGILRLPSKISQRKSSKLFKAEALKLMNNPYSEIEHYLLIESAKNFNQQYARVRTSILEYCEQHRLGNLHSIKILNEESVPMHSRRLPISSATRASYLRMLCVSNNDGKSILEFMVDVERDWEKSGDKVNFRIQLSSMEPAPELADAFLANWSPDEALYDAEILYWGKAGEVEVVE